MSRKKIAHFLAIAIVTAHASITILYLLPKNPLTVRYAPFVDAYMDPVFTQSWGLFAPEPATSSLQLWFRCKTNSLWSPWQDPVANLLREHRGFRITYRGKLLYVYQNIARQLLNRYLEEATKSPGLVPDLLHDTPEYSLATNYVSDLCEANEKEATQAQFVIVKVFPRPFSERKNKNKLFGKVERLAFNAFAIRNN